MKFDDCQFMPFTVHISDANIFKHIGGMRCHYLIAYNPVKPTILV